MAFRLFALAIAIAAATIAVPAIGRWVMPSPIPISRLLKKTKSYVAAHPADANGYYMLGRINSAAYAQGSRDIRMFNEGDLPRVVGVDIPVNPRGTNAPPSKVELQYFNDALSNYQRATQLRSNWALAWCGLGFQCEEALKYRETRKLAIRNLRLKSEAPAANVREEALRCYRRAYQISGGSDGIGDRSGIGPDLTQECAASVVRVLKSRPMSDAERGEAAQIEGKIKEMQSRPRAVTPIVISFEQSDRLDSLLDRSAEVSFDLSGDHTGRRWPWVKPDTGILVWDPLKTGRVTSGLQLFGSVTWWMFWHNGYEPLAALDDDNNGNLQGKELKGIAVWFDRNGNGISDRGEVVPVEKLGICGIKVRPEKHSDGTLWRRDGVDMADGRCLSTFDWTPTSKAPPSQMGATKRSSKMALE